VRAAPVSGFAFVEVVAERRVSWIPQEAIVAAALEPTRGVRAAMGTIISQLSTFVNVQAGGIVSRQAITNETVAGDGAVRERTNIRATTIANETSVLWNAKGVVSLRQGHSGGTRAEHVAVLLLAQVRTAAVIERAVLFRHAEPAIFGQDHVDRTGTDHVAVLVAMTRLRTTAVPRTVVLARTRDLILGQDHPGWTGARRLSILVMAKMRAAAVVDGTCGYLDACPAIVLQQPVIIGTRALKTAVRIRAQMGTSAVTLDALVDVLANSTVLPDSVPRGAYALETTVLIHASVGTRVV